MVKLLVSNYLGSSTILPKKQTSIPISTMAQRNNLSVEEDEENDSFLMAEQKAQDEVEKHPLKDPLHELKSLRTKGEWYSSYSK